MILYAQEEPVDGALAMAIDEVLMETATEPVLRTWRWAETTLTMGCFVRLAEARGIGGNVGPEMPVVRRWTGGGCVVHEKARDFSYSLIFPRDSEAARMRPVASYAWIHERLAAALGAGGIEVGLTVGTEAAGGPSRDCFRSPVPFDVLATGSGEKISGAGQKRTRKGMLHQGNVRSANLPEDFPRRLAAAFAPDVRVEGLCGEILAAAAVLRRNKYASADWTEKY